MCPFTVWPNDGTNTIMGKITRCLEQIEAVEPMRTSRFCVFHQHAPKFILRISLMN